MSNPFRYFNSSPEVIHLAVMMYIRYSMVATEKVQVAISKGVPV